MNHKGENRWRKTWEKIKQCVEVGRWKTGTSRQTVRGGGSITRKRRKMEGDRVKAVEREKEREQASAVHSLPLIMHLIIKMQMQRESVAVV